MMAVYIVVYLCGLLFVELLLLDRFGFQLFDFRFYDPFVMAGRAELHTK